jgi:mono/diheme cytochrome c family protein
MRAIFYAAFAATLLTANNALGDAATVARGKVQGTTGAEVYQHVCQGCHMPGGAGASNGAGAFPALAHNAKLADYGYPVSMVLNGHGGMPWFNGTLSDAQIAMVVTYVRTHFGNNYPEPVPTDFVASAHGPAPVMER